MSKLTREGFRAMHEQAAEALERSRSSLNVLICAGTGCIASGSMKVYENLREECAQRGLQVYVGLTHHGDAEKSLHIKMSGCHGFCEMGPLVHIEPLGVMYVRVKPEDCREIVERTLLGDDIMGSGFSFHIHINRGAGAFVCGEGSALTASIEGKRGMPRVKPPRTVDHGLWGKPTVLNNVETFANVPGIINKGAAWYRSIGTEGSAGTKTFALTGNVVNTGLVEVPMGATLREIIYDIGGGIPNGKKFKAVQIGGPSGGCLTEEHLDYPMDFDSLKKLGAIIGSGGLVVMDEDTCMVEVARFFMHFTQNESCGKCTPCREGTKRMLETLERIINNEGSLADLDLLESLSDTITDTALCGLGQTACKPVMSTLRNFRQDYLRHVVDHHCPICNGRKRRLEIKPELCKGCGKCARNCPMEAISGQPRMPYVIDNEKCIHCGACWGACPFGAIDAIEEE